MFDHYKDIFNQRGASYHAAMQRWPHARRNEFAAILAQTELQASQTLADMPSGGGYLETHVPAGVRITCVETSAQFMALCQPSARVTKVLSELHQTPIPSDSMDVVICLAGLHHVTPKARFFAEAQRILKPGGRFCIADAAQGSAVAKFLDGFVHEHNSMGHCGEYISDQTRRDLRECGFCIADDRQIDYRWTFDSPDSMASFCHLLFGMDKAEPAQVLTGIRKHLGFEVNGSTQMNWGLRFLTCFKPAL